MQKNIFYLVLLLLLSCSDKDMEIQEPNNNKEGYFDFLSRPALEMNDLIISADYQIGILADANFGHLSYEENSPSFKANGVFPEGNLKITINETTLAADREGGGMLIRDAAFANFYGSKANITVTENGRAKSESIYFPKLLSVPQLPTIQPNTVYIHRNDSNTLTWIEDSSNELGVLIMYELFDRENYYEDPESKIAASLLLTEDDGQYSIQALLADKRVKSIKLSLIRLNAIEYNTQKKEKIMIGATTSDHHFYMVK